MDQYNQGLNLIQLLHVRHLESLLLQCFLRSALRQSRYTLADILIAFISTERERMRLREREL